MNKIKYLLISFSLFALHTQAQEADSLLKALDSGSVATTVDAAFKSTHVVLSQSSETQKKHDLDLRIRHHFGDIGGRFGNAHTLYGLDVATDLFIGLDYGVSDRFTVAIGRSKQNELFDFLLIPQDEYKKPKRCRLSDPLSTPSPVLSNSSSTFLNRTNNFIRYANNYS